MGDGIIINSRFTNYADVIAFYNKYLYNLKNLKIIAIVLDDGYKKILFDELKNNSNNSTMHAIYVELADARFSNNGKLARSRVVASSGG